MEIPQDIRVGLDIYIIIIYIIIIISREVSKFLSGNTGKPVTVIEAKKKDLGLSELHLLLFRMIEHLVPHDCKNRYFH